MADETTAKPIMPWQENYPLKPVQATVPPEGFLEKAVGAVQKATEGISKGRMPWNLDWAEKPRGGAVKPSPTFSVPSRVDVKTESMMKTAARISYEEQQPDTRGDASNLAEIDREIAKTKDKSILAILNKERKKYIGGSK